MNTLNVKTGDTVVVIAGKDAGKQGQVLRTYPSKNRIVVSGVNMISRHQKARKAQEKSAIVKKEGTIDVSNVMVICPVCGKATRVKHTIQDGKSIRVCKCGSALDKKFVKDTKKAKKAEKATEVKAEKAKTAEKTEEKVAKKTATKKVVATSAVKETKTSTARKSQRGV